LNTGANDPPPSKGSRLSFKRLIPLLAIAAALAAFFVLGGNKYLTFEAFSAHREHLIQWYAANKMLAVLSYIVLYAALVAVSVPGAIWITLGGGFIFGTAFGTVYVVIGATIGATLVFLATRYALRDVMRARAGNAIRRMEEGFRENALSYLLVLRLVPLFPFWLVNLVPALLGVPLTTYVIGTFFGIIPGSLVYASVGSGLGAIIDGGGEPDLKVIFSPEILGPIIGLVFLSLVPILYKKLKKKSGD
jgi:uncharacterized membrane protein YdjX (TVP38/TMEM64 family)